MPANKFWPQLLLLLPLIACAGATSGGPPAGVGAVGGQNSLDGGNSTTGGGGLPGGDSGQGQAQPSTQQSDPGLGGPCYIRFVVTVKVLRNGLEQSCREDALDLNRRQATEILQGGNTGTMAPPEEPGPGPEVTFNFTTPSDIDERVVKAPTSCTADGQWQTARDDLKFYFIPDGIRCGGFTVKTKADWNPAGTNLTSNTFSGPPLPDLDETTYAVPITVTIDLGLTKFGGDGVQVLGM